MCVNVFFVVGLFEVQCVAGRTLPVRGSPGRAAGAGGVRVTRPTARVLIQLSVNGAVGVGLRLRAGRRPLRLVRGLPAAAAAPGEALRVEDVPVRRGVQSRVAQPAGRRVADERRRPGRARPAPDAVVQRNAIVEAERVESLL